jgi:hypothetical protein
VKRRPFKYENTAEVGDAVRIMDAFLDPVHEEISQASSIGVLSGQWFIEGIVLAKGLVQPEGSAYPMFAYTVTVVRDGRAESLSELTDGNVEIWSRVGEEVFIPFELPDDKVAHTRIELVATLDERLSSGFAQVMDRLERLQA